MDIVTDEQIENACVSHFSGPESWASLPEETKTKERFRMCLTLCAGGIGTLAAKDAEFSECTTIVREILGPGGGLRCDENLADMLRTLQCVSNAKDAEIAELRKELGEEQAAAVREFIIAGVAIRQRDEALAKYEAVVFKCDAAVIALMQERSEARERAINAELQRDILQKQSASLIREFDEARECVKRLYQALHAAATDAGRWAHLDWIEALAATPEHLR